MRGRIRLLVGLILGAATVAALTAQSGVAETLDALSGLSWSGLAAICALQIGAIALCGLAWWCLTEQSSVLSCAAARWIREGTSNVLGLLPGIGELAGARALKLFGARSGDAAASTVMDIVTESVSQLLYTLCGLAPLLRAAGGNHPLQLLGAAAAAAPPALAILYVSRSGTALSLLERFLTRIGQALGFSASARSLNLAANVARLYAHPPRILAATALHFAAWSLGAVQVWAAARFIGRPVSPGAALALASVAYAARGALFVVPMGAGVQEVSFVLVGAVLGIAEPNAIALSLVLRARDVVLGFPAVLVWLTAELRELWLRSGTIPTPTG